MVDPAIKSHYGTGYCNDVSERAFQLECGGQWSKGKSAETFSPAGPGVQRQVVVAAR